MKPDSPPAPVVSALTGGCPRCGSRTLFSGWIRFADTCGDCGLNFAGFNVGDGPAAFLILIVGAALTIGAITLELAVEPPFLVHLVWVPLSLALTVFRLRFGKAFLLGQEYRHEAREGRLS